MPTSTLPTFASAASSRPAGNSNPGDWSRRPNAATQTFRRSSQATNIFTAPQRESSTSIQNNSGPTAGVYVPPHITASRNGVALETRYSREQLLNLFKMQRDSDNLNINLTDLFVGEWDNSINGASAWKWGKRVEPGNDSAMGIEACWNPIGIVEPMGSRDMTDEEKELFTSSVNSPLKAANPSSAREGGQRDGANTRKISLSQSYNGPNSAGQSSPGYPNFANRRREMSESYPFPLSSPAVTGKFGMDEPSAGTPSSTMLRRRGDISEVKAAPTMEEPDNNSSESTPSSVARLGSLKRVTTGPFSAGLNGPSSPWSTAPGPQSAGVAPMGAFSSLTLGGSSNEKRPGIGTPRSESKFRGLMSKSNSEDLSTSVREKPSLAALETLPERERARHISTGSPNALQWPSNEETESFSAEGLLVGSAALQGGDDESPPRISQRSTFDTPNRRMHNNAPGFSAFGLTSDSLAFRGHDYHPSQPFLSQQHGSSGAEEPMSPTFTNPYQSPQQRTSNLRDIEDLDTSSFHLPGLGGFRGDMVLESHHPGLDHNLNRVSSNYDARPFDGNNGPNRGFPNRGGLGSLASLGAPGPWPAGLAVGTPGRESIGFSDSFGDLNMRLPHDLQSPGLAGRGVLNAFGSATNTAFNGSGNIGRGSKLGSMFPPAMQEQMRSGDSGRPPRREEVFQEDNRETDDQSMPFTIHTLGNLGHDSVPRETESPFRTGRGKFDEFYGGAETAQTLRSSETSDSADLPVSSFGQPFSPTQSHSQIHQQPNQSGYGNQQQPSVMQQSRQRLPSSMGSSSSNQPPAAQQKTMVMPDRIRWIYRDPQGNTQGPWSGLEMHDWYRAGFFSPELLVKKAEDSDYEPLAQLIRRIGNSREPFLVPQIGIPGPASTQGGTPWPTQTATPTAPPSAAAAQPPFASSFPSFGTTLTAEQQNALERRKQEEQYLMARQKEHLAQQQTIAKQMQMQGSHGMHSQPLNHHPSAQSLHSQPSYGSITSPKGYQASPMLGSVPGLTGPFENSFRLGGGSAIGPVGSTLDTLGHIQEEEVPRLYERLRIGHEEQVFFSNNQAPGFAQYLDSETHDQRVSLMLAERSRLQREQAEDESSRRDDMRNVQGVNERFRHFRDLRSRADTADYVETPDSLLRQLNEQATRDQYMEQSRRQQGPPNQTVDVPVGQAIRNLSLTEQVQKAASAKQSPAPDSPWAKINTSVPERFHPPQSSSPLPAPAARKNRQNIAESLTAETPSQYESHSVETPSSSIAPWAKEPTEAQKQPSLREIQEVEVRRAAKQEELAFVLRRAALERELATQPIAAAPGLPMNSTWGRSESPATPLSSVAAPAWTKPAATKSIAIPGAPAKKTLQQIQKEEEAVARKQKASAAIAAANNAGIATAATGATPALYAGKRYADLAGKAAAPAPMSSGAWTTVGAGGKLKVPGPVAPSATARAPSGATVTTTALATVSRPKSTTGPSKTSLASAQHDAHEAFKRWATAELRHDLNKGVSVDDFVQGLLAFPPDTDIIIEAVHSASQTMDSRHFAEEFVRRRGLAEKGKVEPLPSGATFSAAHGNEGKGGGGWSEVARKGPPPMQKEENNSFKIVATKKKGGKR